jgi:nucleoside-diphosphate-sugar epimerase
MNDDGMILVTGADGFVGRSVCAALRRAGLDHLGLDRRVCDITDQAQLGAIFRAHRIGAVIHLAAILPTASRANPELATRVNVVGSVNLLEAAVASGVARFVFGSSMSVYGAEGDGSPVSEESPARPTDLYGSAKRYVEIYGEILAKTKALDFRALRIATVVGPGASNTASPWRSDIFDRLSERIVIPYPEDAVLSLVHVEDVAQMLVLLVSRQHVPWPVYNTPAENCRVVDLKRMVESLGVLRVELDSTSRRRTPPVADGRRFATDFAYEARSLEERLRDFAAVR